MSQAVAWSVDVSEKEFDCILRGWQSYYVLSEGEHAHVKIGDIVHLYEYRGSDNYTTGATATVIVRHVTRADGHVLMRGSVIGFEVVSYVLPGVDSSDARASADRVKA